MGIEQHLGESLQGGEAPAVLGAHPRSISPWDVHVRMSDCSEHGQRAVVQGLAMGQSALRSTASCFAGYEVGQEGDGMRSPPLSCVSMGPAPLPLQFTASPRLCSFSLVAALLPGSQSDAPYPQWAILGAGKVTVQGIPSLLPSSPFLAQDTSLLSTASQNGCVLRN